jgi:putative Holliday junction resolvase
MKYLGIDYGTKRIGLALSDEGGRLATPYTVLENQAGIMGGLERLIRDEGVEEIVMGLSMSENGEENPVQKKIKEFADGLERRFELPIRFEKEFFSSFEAHGRQGKESQNARKESFAKPEDLDARAAAVILQRYLDRLAK